MSWFKVDDGFHSSRKVMSIPKRTRWAALGTWTIAGSWSADQLTDGFIPDFMLTEWGTPPAAPQALVDARLWERTEGGYLFRNWTTYQPSKQHVEGKRAEAAERMANLRAGRKGEKPREQAEQDDPFARTDQNSSQNVRNPDPTRPVPTTEANASVRPRKRGTRIPDDFTVTDEMVAWARTHAPNVNGAIATQKFINHWQAKAGKDATKLDWPATWRNWMLNDEERAQTTQSNLTTSEKRIAANLRAVQNYEPTNHENPFEQKALGR